MSNYAVGDEIEIRFPDLRHRRLLITGIVTKVVYTPPPAWSDKQPGYTIIQYREPDGNINCCSNNSPFLSKRSILDRLVEGLE